MKLSFRQGIVAAQMGSGVSPTPNFLQKTVGDTRYIDLIADSHPTILVFAQGLSNYLVEERESITAAWGPFEDNSQTPYLYWDINGVTAELTRGFTLLPPVAQFTWPDNNTPLVDQHWFDKTNTVMKVWNGTKWVTKIRVFAGRLVNLTSILYEPVGSSAVGLNVVCDAGYILSDTDGKPIRKNYQGEFYTSNEGFHLNFSQSVSSVKLEGSELIAIANETIPAFSVVTIVGQDRIGLASSTVLNKEAIGIVQYDLMQNESTHVVFRGNIFNPQWNWPTNSIGKSLYCGSAGELTTVRPISLSAQKLGTVLSATSIFFQIDSETIPAELSASGIQSIVAIAPLNVTSGASAILSIAAATDTTAGVMSALDKLRLNNLINDMTSETAARTSADLLLAPKHNPVFTGTVTLAANPVLALHAVTKQYVDSLTTSGKENTGVAQSIMDAHNAALDPHAQYVLDTDLVTAIAPLATTLSVTTEFGAHTSALDPHSQYASITNVTTSLLAKEDTGVAANLLSLHTAASDPHPLYATTASVTTLLSDKVDAAYVTTQIGNHSGAANPHPLYLLTANLGTEIDNLGTYALQSYVDGKVDALINSAPGALDTLNELANALGNDANFAASVTTLLAGKENVNTASGLLNAHNANPNPHTQYALATDLSSKEDAGTAVTKVADHVSDSDPHTQYYDTTRFDTRYGTLSSDTLSNLADLTFVNQAVDPTAPASGKLTIFADASDKVYALTSTSKVELTNSLSVIDSTNTVISANAPKLKFVGLDVAYELATDNTVITFNNPPPTYASVKDHGVTIATSYSSIDISGNSISASYDVPTDTINIVSNVASTTGGFTISAPITLTSGDLILGFPSTSPFGRFSGSINLLPSLYQLATVNTTESLIQFVESGVYSIQVNVKITLPVPPLTLYQVGKFFTLKVNEKVVNVDGAMILVDQVDYTNADTLDSTSIWLNGVGVFVNTLGYDYTTGGLSVTIHNPYSDPCTIDNFNVCITRVS